MPLVARHNALHREGRHCRLGPRFDPPPPFRNTQKLRLATSAARSSLMWDFMMLALTAIFFATGIGYAYACERL
jgi:hypothetical protein